MDHNKETYLLHNSIARENSTTDENSDSTSK